MRYLFKTDYRQDTTLWRHRGDLFWYGLLVIVLLLVPYMLSEFYVGELGGVFVFAVAGVGMMLLAGYTGLISLGNAAFLGIKAFAAAVLGGFGSIPGALVGGVVIGIVEQLAGYFLPAGFQEVTSNVVLLATLILRPQGLFAELAGKRV